MAGLYLRLVKVIGGYGLIAATATFLLQGIGRDEVILVVVGASAGWLRFRLAPVGQLTLSPIAFFLALLISDGWHAFGIALTALAIGSLMFAGNPLKEILREAGEEAFPALGGVLALLALSNVPSIGRDSLTPYGAAIGVYILLRLGIGMMAAHLTEGIGTENYLAGVSKNSVANLLFLAGVAVGLKTFLYGQFGYLAVILATIALVEFYHPWKLLSEQDEILLANLAMVAQAIDLKDPYTAKHSRNVAKLAVRIARAMGLPEDEVRKVRIGALMHDIGKIGVGTNIIRKPTRLDSSEEHAMRAHPVISADIMQPIELLADAAEIVRHHHEHLDGSGYPSGLRVDQIPIGSRVILVADAFDAMTTDRPYRRGRSHEEALKVLKEHAGRQFDRDAVKALETILPLT